MNRQQLAHLLAELLSEAPSGLYAYVSPFRKWLSTYPEDNMATIEDLAFDDIYPPAALQQQWGYESTKTADPSIYMRHHIAAWCARQGAIRAIEILMRGEAP